VTCGNRNETLKYPGRFHRDTERYFRKTGTIFEKNRFRKIWSTISCLYVNEISVTYSNSTTHWYHSGTTSWPLIQRLWIRFCVTLWNNHTSCPEYLGFFGQNFIFAKFQCETSYWELVCTWWESICGPSWSQIGVITTCRYIMTQFLCVTRVNLG